MSSNPGHGSRNPSSIRLDEMVKTRQIPLNLITPMTSSSTCSLARSRKATGCLDTPWILYARNMRRVVMTSL